MSGNFTVMKYLYIIFVALCLIGCNTSGPNKLTNQKDKIVAVDNNIASNHTARLNDIAVLSYGVGYSLNQVTNPTQPVLVAKEVNKRIGAEAGYSPTIDQIKSMQLMIDNLIATNEQGLIELSNRDTTINFLRDENKLLLEVKDKEIHEYMSQASVIATREMELTSQLNEMDKYAGIGAIWYGLKRLFVRIMWGLGIFTIVFIILRAMAISNPVCAIIFGIFQSIAASVIHLIEMAIPQSIATIDEAKRGLTQVSDAINTTIKK